MQFICLAILGVEGHYPKVFLEFHFREKDEAFGRDWFMLVILCHPLLCSTMGFSTDPGCRGGLIRQDWGSAGDLDQWNTERVWEEVLWPCWGWGDPAVPCLDSPEFPRCQSRGSTRDLGSSSPGRDLGTLDIRKVLEQRELWFLLLWCEFYHLFELMNFKKIYHLLCLCLLEFREGTFGRPGQLVWSFLTISWCWVTDGVSYSPLIFKALCSQ